MEYSQESPLEFIFSHYKFRDGMKRVDRTAVIHTSRTVFWYEMSQLERHNITRNTA
jgi:hypothetical protein